MSTSTITAFSARALRASLPLIAASAALLSLAACASSTGPAAADSANAAQPAYEEGAIVHTVSEADLAYARSTDPITANHAVLWVNGLGCPQCASNIDLQLDRITGVQNIKVDLSTGRVNVDLFGVARPSPARLAQAVDRAGFTLVKIEAN
ncbi:MAG: heavy metal-associated domain-containing protein [Planctomycetota bacterium]|nr:heavy metal-associated domain-containing protein [Planctomycetota bacterium]